MEAVTQHAEGSKQVHESVTVKQTDTISLTDSAYQSMSTDIASVATASGSTYGSNQTRILIRPIPGSDLLMFRKAGDKIITEEYRNIQRALEKRLKDVLTTARQNMSNLSTHLEMVGRNYSEATPKLVVLCAPAAEDAVRSFFQLVYVQTLLSLGDPDNAPLKHIIVPQAPNFASAIENIRVFAQNTHNTDRSTYCGAPITFASHDRKRKRSMPSLATFGGIVKATFGNGETQLLGTSAGHAVGRVRTEHLSVDTDGKAGDQSSQQTFDLLDWIPAECAIGGILLPESFRGVSAGRTAPSYDWTLFSVNAARPNQVIKRGSCVENDAANDVEVHSILKAERPLFQDEVSDPVLLLGAVGGVRRGELSSVPSRIWLTESEGFVDAYLLQLEDGTVCEGDSGAWIVHSAAPEMYGHVVATNVFGDAYVMPALDTFENMRECLGAISVTLPDAHDLEGVTIPTEIATSYKNSNSRPGTPLSVKLSPDGQSSTIASESSNFESPSMPDSAKFLRNRPKRWNPIFKEQRHSHEQNYLQTLAEVGVDIHDVPKAFLTGSLMQGTERMQDFALQTVKDFCRHGLPQACKHVTNSTSLSKRAWMVEVRERTCLEPITREQHLYSNARELFRCKAFTTDKAVHSERRLIYVADPDADDILACMESASYHQVEAVQAIVMNYLRSNTSLRVSIPLQGFQTFQLEFSLPYLVLRAVPTSEKHGRGARNKQQCWTDLSFLNISSSADTNSHHTIHESQVSIVLFGIDHNQWTGYAFARRCCTDTNENAEHEDGSYSDELSKEDGHLLEDELENNPFSLHDGVPSERHDFVWDPRAYWLCIVARRLRIVHQEWEYLVHRVDHAAKALHKSPVSAANANPTTSELNRSLKLMLLVQTLQERILTVIRAWEEFSSPSGDIAYFEDLDECYIHATLNSIHETFENLKQLERKLDSMGKYCERKLLQIRMEVESSRPNYETNEIARRIHSLCLLTNALAFESQKLHRRGTQAAETTSKISRWNVSLIWIITPIIITLLYFGSDRNIFSFDRNTKTFFISMGVLMVALPLITWLLNIVLTKSRAIIFKTVWVRSSSAVRRQAASEKLFLA